MADHIGMRTARFIHALVKSRKAVTKLRSPLPRLIGAGGFRLKPGIHGRTKSSKCRKIPEARCCSHRCNVRHWGYLLHADEAGASQANGKAHQARPMVR